MRSLNTCLCLLALLFAVTPKVSAQHKFLIPEKIERKTEADASGALQWVKWEAPQCPSCTGAGKTACATCDRFKEDAKSCPECQRKEKKGKGYLATCRVCAGDGKIPDPLEHAPCAGCMGMGAHLCTVCNGTGALTVGKAKRPSSCPACRGDGSYPCGGCKGKRRMSVLQLKPPFAEAPVDKLRKAKKDLDAMVKAFDTFSPIGGTKARKAVKALGQAYNVGKKIHPSFKGLAKSTKTYMNKVFAGANFQGHEENEKNTMEMIKANTQYYLKHQQRMMELALKRAEANAKLAGK